MAYWGEIHTNGKFQVGVFGGILNNRGTKDPMSDPGNAVHGLATDINSMFRISPRIVYNSGKVRLALELEYTQAAYGSNYNKFFLPDQVVPVGNLRGLLAIYYFF